MKNELIKIMMAAIIGALVVIVVWPKPKPLIIEKAVPFDITPIVRHIDSLAGLPKIIIYKNALGKTDTLLADTTTPIGRFPREVYTTTDSLPIYIDEEKQFHPFRLGFIYRGVAEDYTLASLSTRSFFTSKFAKKEPSRFSFLLYGGAVFNNHLKFDSRIKTGAFLFYKAIGIQPEAVFRTDTMDVKIGASILFRPRW